MMMLARRVATTTLQQRPKLDNLDSALIWA
jgi:hypothetical protein